MNSEKVRSIATDVEALAETISRSSFKREQFAEFATRLRQFADDMDDPVGPTLFVYSVEATLKLNVRLSDAMRDKFDEWMRVERVESTGGGGTGDGRGRTWSMTFYFPQHEIVRVIGWLCAQGATEKPAP